MRFFFFFKHIRGWLLLSTALAHDRDVVTVGLIATQVVSGYLRDLNSARIHYDTSKRYVIGDSVHHLYSMTLVQSSAVYLFLLRVARAANMLLVIYLCYKLL